jgi:NADH:ubiquinone oxidoreductase subunit 3 (subunit A)
MAAPELVFSPFVLYGIAMGIGLLVYLWARRIAPAPADSGDKRMPYVGGEAWEAQSYQPSYQFFYVAIFFTLAHVAALVIATAPPSASLYATVGYLAIIAVAVMVLRWEQ